MEVVLKQMQIPQPQEVVLVVLGLAQDYLYPQEQLTRLLLVVVVQQKQQMEEEMLEATRLLLAHHHFPQ